MSQLNLLQAEIVKAIKQLEQKAVYSEAILTKKIRDNAKINGKQKAVIAMSDLEKAVSALAEEDAFYEIHLNSANDILIKKGSEVKLLEDDARRRRLSSEKSMTILTNGDLKNSTETKGKDRKKEKRTERKKMNIYDDYE